MPLTRLSSADTNLPNRDGEEIIVIDSSLRNIKVPNSLKNIGVAGDHKAESVFFQIPRYFDGIDLANHSCVIRYINAGNEYGEYKVTEQAMDDDFIVLGWQLTNYVTRYSGVVKFTVQFETKDLSGTEYQWQTVPAQFNILAALPVAETITSKDDSLYRQVIDELDAIRYRLDKLDGFDALKDQVELNTLKIQYLEDNVVYTLKNI